MKQVQAWEFRFEEKTKTFLCIYKWYKTIHKTIAYHAQPNEQAPLNPII